MGAEGDFRNVIVGWEGAWIVVTSVDGGEMRGLCENENKIKSTHYGLCLVL